MVEVGVFLIKTFLGGGAPAARSYLDFMPTARIGKRWVQKQGWAAGSNE